MWEVVCRTLFIYFFRQERQALYSARSVATCQTCAPRPPLAVDSGSSRQGITIITGMRIMEKMLSVFVLFPCLVCCHRRCVALTVDVDLCFFSFSLCRCWQVRPLIMRANREAGTRKHAAKFCVAELNAKILAAKRQTKPAVARGIDLRHCAVCFRYRERVYFSQSQQRPSLGFQRGTSSRQ